MCPAGSQVRSGGGNYSAIALGVRVAGPARGTTDDASCLFLSYSRGRSEIIASHNGANDFRSGAQGLCAGMIDYTDRFLEGLQVIAAQLDRSRLNRMMDLLVDVRSVGGRVFFLGIGGGAANASHAVNDFRKIAAIECYAPSDNVAELTARTNDDGWESCYANWLRVSRLSAQDAVFVFSVGGGSITQGISTNIVRSLEFATRVGARILGVVGRDGGFTAKVADACLIIPTVSEDTVTPLVESFQTVVWHLIVSHPKLKVNEAKWESMPILA